MTRVWFNQWFSTSYGIIEYMKRGFVDEKKSEGVWVIGSNMIYDSVIQNVCDEWYEEPQLSGEAYVEYCLDFCREHSVDVFVPWWNMTLISQNKSRFEELGVRVMAEDHKTISLLEDKAATYDFFKKNEGINVPDYFIVNTADEFEAAYKRIIAKKALASGEVADAQACVKFVKDEGGRSFRRIVDKIDPLQSIRSYPKDVVEFSYYQSVLQETGSFDDLMVMPFISGNEISVDCLRTSDGIIAVQREKTRARHERIIRDERIYRMVEIIIEETNLECPCNIQFMMQDDIPYLLEINARMSGGLQMSCLATGINIPALALRKILGEDIIGGIDFDTLGQKDGVVSYIEMPEMVSKY